MSKQFSRIVLPPRKNVIQGILQPEFKPHIRPKERIVPTSKRKMKKQICATCDFRDKESGRCLIKQLGSKCPYTNGGNGYFAFTQI